MTYLLTPNWIACDAMNSACKPIIPTCCGHFELLKCVFLIFTHLNIHTHMFLNEPLIVYIWENYILYIFLRNSSYGCWCLLERFETMSMRCGSMKYLISNRSLEKLSFANVNWIIRLSVASSSYSVSQKNVIRSYTKPHLTDNIKSWNGRSKIFLV